ncbi:tRNA-dihydrouridine synthase family protein [Candidatus Micrarchaeota archaeon]|nr:tRNA-dihydrouridine synthase family protein [Candidatus Micrarchaeota archaeon]
MQFDFSKIKYSLAPMAGYTDAAFRALCFEYGADYSVTEFVSAESVIRDNWKVEELTYIPNYSKPTGIQIFGSNPESMAKAASILEKKAAVIDINMGCPAPKVTRNCGGAALLENPEIAKSIIDSVISAVKTPVTVKMRLGVNSAEKSIEFAKMVESCGVRMLCVHGRTLKQGYTGTADWAKIREIKSSLSIPVFGNGDVKNYSDSVRFFENTLCDGVSIGRGALGSPFVFQMLKKKEDFEPDFEMRKKAFFRYLELREKFSMRPSIGDIKGHALRFIQGISHATDLRLNISRAKTKEEIVEVFKEA